LEAALMAVSRAQRRRERIEQAIRADADRSNRSIAAEIGCSHMTVGRVRAGLAGQLSTSDEPDKLARGQNPGAANLIEPAGLRNDRAVRHGAHSEQLVAPLRERFLLELRERFNAVDDDLLVVQAHRRAQLELLSAWLDEHGVVRGGKRGEITAAATFAERIASSYERQHERLVALQREAETVDPQAALDAYVAGLPNGEEAGDGDD
jgi:hypothetical protein